MHATRFWVLALASLVAGCGETEDEDGPVPWDGLVRVELTNPPPEFEGYTFIAAYQDGDSEWQVAPAPTGGTYAFPVTASTWRFMWTWAATDPTLVYGDWLGHVHVYGFTVEERTELTVDVYPSVSPALGFQLWLDNPPASGMVAVGFGRDRIWIVSPSTTEPSQARYSMYTNPGTYDLVLVDPSCASPSCTSVGATGSGMIQRNVTHADPTAVVMADFAGAQPLVTAPVVATGATVASTTLYTEGGTVFSFVDDRDGSDGFSTVGLAASGGDVYKQEVQVPPVTVERWASSISEQIYVAPPVFAPVSSSWASPNTIATTWSSYDDAVGYEWVADQMSTCGQWGNGHIRNCDTRWTVALSSGFVGANPAFQSLDLSALPGWFPRLNLTRASTEGRVRVTTSTAGVTDFPAASLAAAGTDRVFIDQTWSLAQ